jgi:hypothetical protein
MPDQLYPWLYMQIEPNDNPAPKFTTFKSQFNGTTTTPVQFSATVTDGNTMTYKWIYGDGTTSGWVSSPNLDKQYTKDGIYSAWLVSQETNGADYFMVSKRTTVKVIDIANTAPRNVAFTFSPGDPDSGTRVYLNGTAVDDNPGDTLTYSWNFGDGTTDIGQNVIHQFAKGDPSYNVKLMVDDGHLGQAARPVNASKSIAVKLNTAPTCSVPDVTSGVIKNIAHVYTITTYDPDTRDSLRYTFDWGDGSPKTVSTLPGATHTYANQGTKTLTVWADDRTGLAMHNVTDTASIYVANSGTPHAPVAGTVTATSAVPGRGDVVKFFASATDVDGDPCLMTFDFGDGTTAQAYQPAAGATVNVTHVFTTVDLYAVYVTAFDGFGSDQSDDPLYIDVQPTTDIVLVAGWNLISVPRVGFGYKAGSLGLATGDVVVGYNSVTGLYNRSYTVGVSPAFKNFWMLPSEGYWVYSLTAKTLHVQGTVPTTPQSRVITVPSGGGWALIGFCSLSTTLKASNLPSMWSVTGGVSIVADYDEVSGTYKTWNPGAPPFKDFSLTAGSGYWLYVKSSGTLTYTP